MDIVVTKLWIHLQCVHPWDQFSILFNIYWKQKLAWIMPILQWYELPNGFHNSLLERPWKCIKYIHLYPYYPWCAFQPFLRLGFWITRMGTRAWAGQAPSIERDLQATLRNNIMSCNLPKFLGWHCHSHFHLNLLKVHILRILGFEVSDSSSLPHLVSSLFPVCGLAQVDKLHEAGFVFVEKFPEFGSLALHMLSVLYFRILL